MVSGPDAALRELGALIVAAVRHGCPALNQELAPVLDRLDLAYDDGPGVAIAALKVALGITEDAATAAGGEQ